MNTTLFIYTLHLADNTLILGQRNSEWCGHGPVLEQDIAITNISLDLLGQARNYLQYAADIYNKMDSAGKQKVDQFVPRLWKSYGRQMNEDDLAFLRDENQYLNLLISELPKGDWAFTILRQFFFSSFQDQYYRQLRMSADENLSAMAEKSLKEVAYHLRWSSEWVVRLGEGTEESRQRIETALNELWMFSGEMFKPAAFETDAQQQGFGVDLATAREGWAQKVREVFEEATLLSPESRWMQEGGKQGKHTEHLGYILAEMQYLQRAYPDARW